MEPPTEWWTGGDVLSSDRKPAFLALGLAIVFCAIFALPGFRNAFELQTLQWIDVAFIITAILIWLAAVRFAWRWRLLERFFTLS